jgi:hypothetical protein
LPAQACSKRPRDSALSAPMRKVPTSRNNGNISLDPSEDVKTWQQQIEAGCRSFFIINRTSVVFFRSRTIDLSHSPENDSMPQRAQLTNHVNHKRRQLQVLYDECEALVAARVSIAHCSDHIRTLLCSIVSTPRSTGTPRPESNVPPGH